MGGVCSVDIEQLHFLSLKRLCLVGQHVGLMQGKRSDQRCAVDRLGLAGAIGERCLLYESCVVWLVIAYKKTVALLEAVRHRVTMLRLQSSSSRWTAFFLLCLTICSLLTPAGKLRKRHQSLMYTDVDASQ